MNINKKEHTYFCDHCKVNKDDENLYFSHYQKQKYEKHKQTQKHKEKIACAKDASPNFFCNYCGEFFNSWSWDSHQKRNKTYWDNLRGLKFVYGYKSIGDKFEGLTCNNFICDGKRFSTFQQMVEFNDLKIINPATEEEHIKAEKKKKQKEEREKKEIERLKPLDDPEYYKNEFYFETCDQCLGYTDPFEYGQALLEKQFTRQHGSNFRYKWVNNQCGCRSETEETDSSSSDDELEDNESIVEKGL